MKIVFSWRTGNLSELTTAGRRANGLSPAADNIRPSAYVAKRLKTKSPLRNFEFKIPYYVATVYDFTFSLWIAIPLFVPGYGKNLWHFGLVLE